MSRAGCLLKDSEHSILFAENSQILLKISVIPILLTFIYLVAVKQPTQLIIAALNCHTCLQHILRECIMIEARFVIAHRFRAFYRLMSEKMFKMMH
jgi:hypothetical protein